MEAIVSAANRRFNLTRSDIFDGDPRVSDWFLMNNLGSVLTMIILYLLMVKHGPAFMAKRAPFKMTPILLVYNFALVILSAYIFYEEANASWWYFFSKIIEFLDTAFFILRKKDRQVTFLHVYHHSTMAAICWYVAKYVPGGEKFYGGGFNCLVHVFMYTYYGLSAMGPQMQKYLWWKRYLTEFQLLQFMFVNVRSIITFFHGPCEYPKWINVFALFFSSTLLLFFLNFYIKSYKTNSSKLTSENGSTEKSIQKSD